MGGLGVDLQVQERQSIRLFWKRVDEQGIGGGIGPDSVLEATWAD